MVRRFTQLLIVCSSCCFLQSCALRSVYIPVSQNVPLFDSNKALQASGYFAANHLELQTALKPSRHFAIAANINFGNGIAVYDCALGRSTWTHGGRWRYEVFAGFGYTTNVIYPGSNDFSLFKKHDIDYEVHSLYQRYYLQPALGFTGTIEVYQLRYYFALSSRISALHFNDFTYREIDKDLTTNPAFPVYRVNRTEQDKMLYLLEPCLSNRVYRGHLFGALQLQAMIPYSNEIDVHYTKFSPGLLLSVGLGYEMPIIKKKVTWVE